MNTSLTAILFVLYFNIHTNGKCIVGFLLFQIDQGPGPGPGVVDQGPGPGPGVVDQDPGPGVVDANVGEEEDEPAAEEGDGDIDPQPARVDAPAPRLVAPRQEEDSGSDRQQSEQTTPTTSPQ